MIGTVSWPISWGKHLRPSSVQSHSAWSVILMGILFAAPLSLTPMSPSLARIPHICTCVRCHFSGRSVDQVLTESFRSYR